jgi:flagellar basal-body rod protein FlgC
MSSAINIAVTGLNDAAERVANAASSIVNASSTSPLPHAGQPYSGFVPQDVVTLSDSVSGNNLGVTTTTQPTANPYIVAYDPNSSQANAQGLVAAPNIDLTSEIVNANVASVNYAADATVIKIAEKTQKSLLDIVT